MTRLGTYQVTAAASAAHGNTKRVDATTAPQLRRRPSHRGRARKPRLERRAHLVLPRARWLLQRRPGTGDVVPTRLRAEAGRASGAPRLDDPDEGRARQERRHCPLRLQPHGVRPPVHLPRRLGRLLLDSHRREHRLGYGPARLGALDLLRVAALTGASREHSRPRFPRRRHRLPPGHRCGPLGRENLGG